MKAQDGAFTGFTHETPYAGATNVWLTPPYIIKALGPFDLDPCAAVGQPWATASRHFTIKDDGLKQPWEGRVWLNPPYGPYTGLWLARLADHGNGIALVFARTETRLFARHVWDHADGLFFITGRLKFHRPTGELGKSAGAPSVLIAYGKTNFKRLVGSGIPGRAVPIIWEPGQ